MPSLNLLRNIVVNSSDILFSLAPTDLPIYRDARYDGSGFSISLNRFTPEDVSHIIQVYQAVKRTYDLWLYMQNAPDYDVMRDYIVAEFGSDTFVTAARLIGTSTYVVGEVSPLLRKIVHDIRSNALTCLTGTVYLLETNPEDKELVKGAVFFARDQAKMMRNAIVDLDVPTRQADESYRLHDIGDFVQKWHGAAFKIAGKLVRIEVDCLFEGSISNRCLENSAIDRILYNYINNAARFSADKRVLLSIFPVGNSLVRWVVQNTISEEQKVWLYRETGMDLKKLYRGGLTREGQGVGLSGCLDFIVAGFGLPAAEEALEGGYLGATVSGDIYCAWFHWPAYAV